MVVFHNGQKIIFPTVFPNKPPFSKDCYHSSFLYAALGGGIFILLRESVLVNFCHI